MKTLLLFSLLILIVGCSSGTIVMQGAARPPVMQHWENLYLYFSPPPNYIVIGMVTGSGSGLSGQGKMDNALEGMKEQAREAGATGVLLQSAGITAVGAVSSSIWSGGRYGGSSFGFSAPVTGGSVSGIAIYVPADAARHTLALQAHESTCAALSTADNKMEAALKAAKKTRIAANIVTAKGNLRAADNAEDANFCGDDDWYAEQIEAQEQQMDTMRAEAAASERAGESKTDESQEAKCEAAAAKNDLQAWRKFNCK
jgi:hypothetical protein